MRVNSGPPGCGRGVLWSPMWTTKRLCCRFVCMYVYVNGYMYVFTVYAHNHMNTYIHTHAHTLSLAMHIHAYMDQSKNA